LPEAADEARRTGLASDGAAMTRQVAQVKVKRVSRRSRFPLTVASGSVVLAHAAGAGRARLERALLAGARRRPAAGPHPGAKELR